MTWLAWTLIVGFFGLMCFCIYDKDAIAVLSKNVDDFINGKDDES